MDTEHTCISFNVTCLLYIAIVITRATCLKLYHTVHVCDVDGDLACNKSHM